MTEESVPADWRAAVGRQSGRFLFRVLYSCKAFGADRMPRDRPVLLAANHTGYLDGALVFAMAPRPSHFLVLDKTFDGFLDHLLTLRRDDPDRPDPR